jgi:hypothetical protein
MLRALFHPQQALPSARLWSASCFIVVQTNSTAQEKARQQPEITHEGGAIQTRIGRDVDEIETATAHLLAKSRARPVFLPIVRYEGETCTSSDNEADRIRSVFGLSVDDLNCQLIDDYAFWFLKNQWLGAALQGNGGRGLGRTNQVARVA